MVLRPLNSSLKKISSSIKNWYDIKETSKVLKENEESQGKMAPIFYKSVR